MMSLVIPSSQPTIADVLMMSLISLSHAGLLILRPSALLVLAPPAVTLLSFVALLPASVLDGVRCICGCLVVLMALVMAVGVDSEWVSASTVTWYCGVVFAGITAIAQSTGAVSERHASHRLKSTSLHR